MPRLLAEDISHQEYAVILERLLACHSLLEQIIQRYIVGLKQPLPGWLDPNIYLRSGDIQADLLALGHLPHQSRQPLSLYGWDAQTMGSMAGVLYVLAGSTLGGQVIFRALRQNLPTPFQSATRFFQGPPSSSLTPWPVYKTLLCEALQSPCDVDEAVEGARKTFGLFIQFLAPAPSLNEPPRLARELAAFG